MILFTTVQNSAQSGRTTVSKHWHSCRLVVLPRSFLGVVPTEDIDDDDEQDERNERDQNCEDDIPRVVAGVDLDTFTTQNKTRKPTN